MIGRRAYVELLGKHGIGPDGGKFPSELAAWQQNTKAESSVSKENNSQWFCLDARRQGAIGASYR